jgi:N-acetylmuramoyl-L-alanine amidase
VDETDRDHQMRKTTNYIVVHCSASPANAAHVDAKEIDRWHRKRGWLMIGYHYVITRDAVLQKGRDLDKAGAHVAGHNHESIGICLVGGTEADWKTPEDNFTPQQMETLYRLLLELRGLYPLARIVGHRELDPKKACPVFDIKKWLTSHPDLGHGQPTKEVP